MTCTWGIGQSTMQLTVNYCICFKYVYMRMYKWRRIVKSPRLRTLSGSTADYIEFANGSFNIFLCFAYSFCHFPLKDPRYLPLKILFKVTKTSMRKHFVQVHLQTKKVPSNIRYLHLRYFVHLSFSKRIYLTLPLFTSFISR